MNLPWRLTAEKREKTKLERESEAVKAKKGETADVFRLGCATEMKTTEMEKSQPFWMSFQFQRSKPSPAELYIIDFDFFKSCHRLPNLIKEA